MQRRSLNKKLKKYLVEHQIEKKFDKQLKLLLTNFRHPSLNTERLEPKHFNLYSFRIDRKYRATFLLYEDMIVIVGITDHYHKQIQSYPF